MVKIAIGKEANKTYGLLLPHLLCVWSTIVPIIGSFNASYRRVPSMIKPTAVEAIIRPSVR